MNDTTSTSVSASTVQKLIHMAAKRFGREAANLRPSDDFFDALDIDSLKAMELLTEVEETFDIEVPDYELQGVRTFSALAMLVDRRLR